MNHVPPEVSRRDALRLTAASAAGVPLALLLAGPANAQAVAARPIEDVGLALPGGQRVRAKLARPAAARAPAMMLIHENQGITEHFEQMASLFAQEGFLALAIDLFDGQTAADQAEAQRLQLTGKINPAVATETVKAWIGWLRAHPNGTGKVGTVGWCFGGAWSLNASLAAPVDATVIYYGRVPADPAALAPLASPVLGHFGLEDRGINQEMVGAWQRAMAAASKRAEVHWYPANHAFANPTGNRYHEESARLAWGRTLAFLRTHLGS